MGLPEITGWLHTTRRLGQAMLTAPFLQHAQVAVLLSFQHAHSQWLSFVALTLSHLGNYSSYVLLGAALLWLFGPLLAGEFIFLTMLSMVAADLGKLLFVTDRPIGYPGIQSEYVESAGGASFPSGHALVAMAVWPRLAQVFRRFRGVFWVLPVAIGLSRLYLGVHWPVDVLAGWLLGWWLQRLRLGRQVAGADADSRHSWPWRWVLRQSAYWLFLLVCLCTLPLVPDTSFAVRFGLTLSACLPFLEQLRPVRTREQAVLRLAVALPGFLVIAGAGETSVTLRPALPYILAIYTALATYLFTRWPHAQVNA